MALTGLALTDEIQALCGRPTNQVLLTNDRCTRWQNEAVKKIAEECPDLEELQFTNTESIDTTVTLLYALNEITLGDISEEEKVCHIFDVFYLDGNETRQLEYIHPDEFDAAWPDPTHTDIPHTKPTHWTRQGDLSEGYVKMMPLCLTAYCDDDLKFVGSMYPREFTTEDTSEGRLKDCDEAIIAYGVWQGFKAIGDDMKAALWRKTWTNPEPIYGEDYGELEKIKFRSSREHGWDGNIFYSRYE